ncbi:MAG: hypothetical protein D6705_18260 [Deltaproteobacteria bacterium]|nr:MAG: hypothetical protein D6705_18260 [Deltaproteobacteria bacterium]
MHAALPSVSPPDPLEPLAIPPVPSPVDLAAQAAPAAAASTATSVDERVLDRIMPVPAASERW